MNFRTFMYYCALCGGWAALIAWAVQQVGGMQSIDSPYIRATMIAVVLGVLLAGVIVLLDALMNAVGFARIIRVAICLAVGLVGSAIFGFIGELIHKALAIPTAASSEIWALP